MNQKERALRDEHLRIVKVFGDINKIKEDSEEKL